MPTCQEFQDYFSAYLDGEIPDAQKLIIEQHLQKCIPCQHIIQELKEAWEMLEDYEDEWEIPKNKVSRISNTSCPPLENQIIFSKSIRKFYSQTLPTALLSESLQCSSTRSFPRYFKSICAGILCGLCLFWAIGGDDTFPEGLDTHLHIWNHPDFETVSTLSILEYYEVLEYFSPGEIAKYSNKKNKGLILKENKGTD